MQITAKQFVEANRPGDKASIDYEPCLTHIIMYVHMHKVNFNQLSQIVRTFPTILASGMRFLGIIVKKSHSCFTREYTTHSVPS